MIDPNDPRYKGFTDIQLACEEKRLKLLSDQTSSQQPYDPYKDGVTVKDAWLRCKTPEDLDKFEAASLTPAVKDFILTKVMSVDERAQLNRIRNLAVGKIIKFDYQHDFLYEVQGISEDQVDLQAVANKDYALRYLDFLTLSADKSRISHILDDVPAFAA